MDTNEGLTAYSFGAIIMLSWAALILLSARLGSSLVWYCSFVAILGAMVGLTVVVVDWFLLEEE